MHFRMFLGVHSWEQLDGVGKDVGGVAPAASKENGLPTAHETEGVADARRGLWRGSGERLPLHPKNARIFLVAGIATPESGI